jgi:hypothetical protein
MPVHFPDVKATFIHVPKTGGTSFYEWIGRNMETYEQLPHNDYANGCMDAARARWGDLGTTFSFVRNPYSRLVSMYTYHYTKAREYVANPSNHLPMKLVDYMRVIAVSQKGFDYWLECVCYDKPELYNIGDAAPDRMSVSSWFNGTMPDIIIKTEELNQEFYRIQNLLGSRFEPLPWVNTSEHKPYREYYNTDTRRMVEMKFKDDLDNFNYEF